MKVLNFLGLGKNPLKSMTVWGVGLFTMGTQIADQLCSTGVMSYDACATMQMVTQNVGGILTALGVRKAAQAPNLEA